MNGTSLRDITVLTMRSGRSTYDVPLYTSRIVHLRMPVGQARDGLIVLHRLWVTRGSRTVAQANPAKLPITPSFARRTPTPNGAAFVATTSTPFLDLPIELDTHESAARLFLAKVASDPLTTVVGFLVALTLAAAALSVWVRRQWALPIALLLTLVAVRGLPWLSWRLPLRDSVSQAVSFASYQGLWKMRERFVLEAAAVAAVAVPALVLYALRRWRHHRGPTLADPDVAVNVVPLPRRATTALVGVPILLAALAGAPNLRELVGGPPQYAPSWDANNLIFWHYLIAKVHLAPMKDFFWPYSFQWLFDKPVPWGDVMTYAAYLSFWTYLAVGTYWTLARFFAGRGLCVRYILLVGFWLSALLADYAPFPMRYIAALAVLVLYTGIDPAERLRSWKRLIFGLALTELALFEAAQTIYIFVPLAFLVLAESALATPRTRHDVARRLGLAAAAIAPALGAAAVIYIVTGELGGTANYYEQLGAVTAADGLPGQLDTWVTHPTTLDAFIFWSVPLALAIGVYGALARSGRLRHLYLVLVALALLALMIMQKQALRPSITPQIWLPVVFPLAFWAVAEPRLPFLRRWSLVTMAAGAMAATILVAGGYRTAWHAVASGPHRVSQSIGALLHDRAALAATARRAYVPKAFERFRVEQPVVEALRRDPRVRAGGPIWILGDDSPITMMLGNSWPYYFNDFYDAAPLAFQKKVLRLLQKHAPVRVVWPFAPQAMVFDTVPQVVRAPLLFEWAVTHLEPEQTIGTFAILRPKREGERIPLAWWRRRIGSSIDLGHIPTVAGLPDNRCSYGADCGDYLVATIPSRRPIPAAFEIPVNADGLRFEVKFAASPGTRRYVVPLGRLWFWNAATIHSLQSTTFASARISLERRRTDPNILY